ncbi:MAG: hypothetical protein ACSHWZ_10375 [Sulfitobacter sp.]
MPRQIIFHAGFHKTGTSTTQAILRANRAALMPHLAIRLKGQMPELIRAARGYSTLRDTDSLNKVTARFKGLLKTLPGMPRRRLILSAEELCGHMPGRGTLADYSAAPILLYALWDIAHEAFPKAEKHIFLTTRAPDAWLRSAWAEHVKSSAMRLDFDAYRARYEGSADLRGVVGDIAARVPCAVHSAALEDCAALPLGPADPLLELCALPDDLRAGLQSVPPANTRLSDTLLAAMLEANRQHDTADARNAAKAALLEAKS